MPLTTTLVGAASTQVIGATAQSSQRRKLTFRPKLRLPQSWGLAWRSFQGKSTMSLATNVSRPGMGLAPLRGPM